MYTVLFCSLVGLVSIQTARAFPNPHDEHAHFEEVMEKLAELGDGAASDREVLQHVHDHVEEVEAKVGQNWELLVELRNRQKWLSLCRIPGENPCANGGTCILDEETDDRACACSFGWQGPTCEEEYDPCTSVECENGGSCVNGTCRCMDGFTGEHCETGVCAVKEAEYDALEFPLPGMERPRCNADGTYAPYQYAGSQAVCTTRDGEYLRAYSLDRWDSDHKKMECNCAIEEYLYSKAGSEQSFSCNPDGSFGME